MAASLNSYGVSGGFVSQTGIEMKEDNMGTTQQLEILKPEVNLQPIESKLALLKQQAEELAVIDAATYTNACQLALAGRAEIKTIGRVLDPGIDSAKDHLNSLRNAKAAFVAKWEAMIGIAEKKAETWKAEERRKAEAEQRRINEERRLEAQRKAEEERKERERIAEQERKQREREAEAARKAGEIGKREAERLKKEAAEAAAREKARAAEDARIAATQVQEVKVETAVPKVAGIKQRVNWKFKVVNQALVPRAFLMPDEVSIGQEVRRIKDKAKAESMIPGILVWDEDSI